MVGVSRVDTVRWKFTIEARFRQTSGALMNIGATPGLVNVVKRAYPIVDTTMRTMFLPMVCDYGAYAQLVASIR